MEYVATARPEADELLAIEEADAWLEYLESTRGAPTLKRYEEIEPWAWARLSQRRKAIATRRGAQRKKSAG